MSDTHGPTIIFFKLSIGKGMQMYDIRLFDVDNRKLTRFCSIISSS